ncbi:hypothetical protein [Sphingomonas sp. FARSPH]|uniref:hypothetical protein n=1 Tax=Sphingomonas sp. FARSPH TaxID=2219696 RepID=UPI000F73D5B4|nr:hypothetical protein [Sphingomonas sp. FARSPH]
MSSDASKSSHGERMDAAIALVVRAICLIESEGEGGAAFAAELQRAIDSTRTHQTKDQDR